LRTTRNRQIETAVNEWKKKHRRKKIGKEKRKCCVDGLPSTTIFDVLYRLRIRSNYADADLYLLNISNECDAVRLYECFTGIAWHTLFVFELIMTKYLGKSTFGDIVSGFLNDEKSGFSTNLLHRRWEIISGLL